MPTCQGHTQTTDAQLSHSQTSPYYTYIRSEDNEDVLLKCSHCTYTSKYKNIMWKHGINAHREWRAEVGSESNRGTEILAESGSRNAPLKLALPKPVSSASLFPAYSESSRLDIQGTYLLTKIGFKFWQKGQSQFLLPSLISFGLNQKTGVLAFSLYIRIHTF